MGIKRKVFCCRIRRKKKIIEKKSFFLDFKKDFEAKKFLLNQKKISVVGFRTNLNFRHNDISRLTERGNGRIALRITAAYREILQEKK